MVIVTDGDGMIISDGDDVMGDSDDIWVMVLKIVMVLTTSTNI